MNIQGPCAVGQGLRIVQIFGFVLKSVPVSCLNQVNQELWCAVGLQSSGLLESRAIEHSRVMK